LTVSTGVLPNSPPFRSGGAVFAQAPTGCDIMKQADERYTGEMKRVRRITGSGKNDSKDIYGRRVIRVRKDSYIFTAVDFYDRQDRLLKTLRVSGISRLDGIWTAQKMEMPNVQDKHSAVIGISEIRFNVPLAVCCVSRVKSQKID
jgi:hypothetical protein